MNFSYTTVSFLFERLLFTMHRSSAGLPSLHKLIGLAPRDGVVVDGTKKILWSNIRVCERRTKNS